MYKRYIEKKEKREEKQEKVKKVSADVELLFVK